MKFTAQLLTFAIVLVATTAVLSVRADYIKFSQCADKIHCTLGCHTVDLPAESCLPLNKNGTATQILRCDQQQGLCADFEYFSDSSCRSPTATQAFVCNECNIANKKKAQCANVNGVNYLDIQQCDDRCGVCATMFNVSAGPCVQDPGNSNQYMRYLGPRVCSMVTQLYWLKSEDCGITSPFSINRIPSSQCMSGGKLNCVFDGQSKKLSKK